MIRRAVDVLVAGAALAVLAPVMLVAIVAIIAEDGWPVLFTQQRAGRLGVPFHLLKFRSMRVNQLSVAAMGQVKGDHHLVTRVGRVIRRLKIDELPQLINVLAGDMALVGPRPTVPEQVSTYSAFQRRRLHVRPGMTGWAQVNGNVELSWEERIMLDVWYVDHRSLLLDARILLLTLQVLLTGERPNYNALEIARTYADSAGGGR